MKCFLTTFDLFPPHKINSGTTISVGSDYLVIKAFMVERGQCQPVSEGKLVVWLPAENKSEVISITKSQRDH